MRRARVVLTWLTLVFSASLLEARAQPAPPATEASPAPQAIQPAAPPPRDSGVTLIPATAPEEFWKPPASRFHDSWFVWESSTTTQTFGLGSDYQTKNPTSEMMFRLLPRFYLRDEPRWNMAVRTDLRLIRELTNSDSTAERGQWDFVDAPIWLATGLILDPRVRRKSEFILRFPYIVAPISRVSYSGRHGWGVGAGVELIQKIPALGPKSTFLPQFGLWPTLFYNYRFAGDNVATSSEITRIRVDPSGQVIPSNQLNGGALPQHEIAASLRFDTYFTKDLILITQVSARYERRYALKDNTPICNVTTGCVDVPLRSNASRWSVATLFVAELWYQVSPVLNVGGGYQNLSPQLGADGQRRNFFYSPEARGLVSAIVVLDALYDTLAGKPSEAHSTNALRPASVQ